MIEFMVYMVLSVGMLLALAWFFIFEYRYYRVRVLRKHLFDARDLLFAAAANGAMSFDDRAYGMARSVINGLLRKAEALSMLYLVGLATIGDKADREDRIVAFEKRFGRATEKLSDAGKTAVIAALEQAHFSVLSHVLHISVVFALPIQLYKLKQWIAVRLGALTSREEFSARVGRIETHMQSQLRELDRQAYALGESVEYEHQAFALAA